MSDDQKTISIVGAGLAGSEAALQLAAKGFRVRLYEMRPQNLTPAHKTGHCAELVCSNSFGTYAKYSAPGQLKWEAEQMASSILESAFRAHVPSGQALGMDREYFAKEVSEKIAREPNIEKIDKIVESLDEIPRPTIVATGPLTHEKLAHSIQEHFGTEDFLYFFDAIAPILDTESINMDVAWKQDRYDKGSGDGDYINCPMNKEQYYSFIEEIKKARKIESKDFEKNTPYFESCMPIEAIIERGDETLRFGPMSPKGLTNPHNPEEKAYAVVQLRQDNKMATAYNIVGFQTKMAYPEQKRIFRMIPGLEEAEFLKLGSIHRNLYIHSPKLLNPDLSSKKDPLLFFAGQITGVEGYFESTCIGLLVSQFLTSKLNSEEMTPPPATSALGAILRAITEEDKNNFQPTNINFGLFPPFAKKLRKAERRVHYIERARRDFLEWKNAISVARETQKFTEEFSRPILKESDNQVAKKANAYLDSLQSL